VCILSHTPTLVPHPKIIAMAGSASVFGIPLLVDMISASPHHKDTENCVSYCKSWY
jgi:hypothetical protein